MLRGAILLSFILVTTAKYYEHNVPDLLTNDNELNGAFEDISSDPGTGHSKPVWVMKVRTGWEDVIEPASAEEVQEFEEANGPLIERYLRRRGPIKARNASKLDENMTVGKEDIFKLINKFALHSNVDPDSYLTNEEETNSVALYIRSPHAFMVINVGHKQWHFSIVNLPTPLPSWFYEEHMGTSAIAIPEEVKQPFYLALWRLINVLGFPIY